MSASKTNTVPSALTLEFDPEAYRTEQNSIRMTQMSGNPIPLLPTRKRSDTSEEGDDGGSKKRSRGRPRLETKDQTAADRRRTQIRLAQRAYRNRKDTAIDSLRKKVKDLEQVNEDMGREFMNFSDFVLGQGTLQMSPEVARRLNDATRKFLALSRKATEDASDEGDDNTAEETTPEVPEVSEVPAPRRRREGSKRGSNDSASSSGDRQSTPNTEWSLEDPHLSGVQALSDPFQQFGPLAHLPINSISSINSITYPSTSDSSFPVMNPQAPISLFSTPYTESPFGTLPMPLSYAENERSFGRRFQRATVEAGLALALMDNPPPDKYMAVFSFCLQFESRQEIIRRLSIVLDRTRNESLNNWKYPFTNLGGAGTWIPGPGSTGKVSDSDSSDSDVPIGNHGLPQPYKRAHNTTGLSTGPFNQDIEMARDVRLDERMRMLYPGFEGDFFDADEVDGYLRHRGIVIHEGKDYVEAEIDLEVFDKPPDLPPRHFGSSGQEFFKQNSATNSSDLSYMYSNGFNGSNANAWETSTTASMGTSTAFDSSIPLPTLDPQLDSFTVDLQAENNQQFDQTVPSFGDMGEIPWRVWEIPPPPPTKTKVTIDVNRLVTELVNAAVCLGRSPGIRPKDVHKAVKLSIILHHN